MASAIAFSCPRVRANGSDAMNRAGRGRVRRQGNARLLRRVAALEADGELESEELVEREPPPRPLLVCLRRGIVVLGDGPRQRGEVGVAAVLLRQRVVDAEDVPDGAGVERFADNPAHRAVGNGTLLLTLPALPLDLAAADGGVERHDASGVHEFGEVGGLGVVEQFPLRVLELEASIEDADLAAEHDLGCAARGCPLELRGEVRLAEPDRAHVAGLVAHGRLGRAESASEVEQ